PPDRMKISDEAQFNAVRAKFFKDQGDAAALRDSDKSHALLTMVNAGDQYDPAPIRTAMLTHEGYSLIWRLLQQGPGEVELSLSNSFSREPSTHITQWRNSVARKSLTR